MNNHMTLLYTSLVQTDNNFSYLSSNELKTMSHSIVNKIFSNNLNINFLDFTIVYTDGCLSSFGRVLILHT